MCEGGGGRKSRGRLEDRGIDNGDSQAAWAVLMIHASEKDDLAARWGGGGVGDGLKEGDEDGLRGVGAERECAAADDLQSEVGQGGDGAGDGR